jgi:hypothetical protein
MKSNKSNSPMKDTSKFRTVCEVLREINDMHQIDNEHDKTVRIKLIEVQSMAKKMSYELFKYSKKRFKNWWKKNYDYEKDVRERLSKDYLVG